jgi:hypothetical protein
LAEVGVPRGLFRKILRLIDDLRPRPAPAWIEKIDGNVKTTGEVHLDGGKDEKMGFRTQENRKSGHRMTAEKILLPRRQVRGCDFHEP